ncbi:MAG: tRNA (adenosine(37)-N6)-threonylcarbamoyltransferase complex ATPase subunit type 1 TsaE, partial [Planctomycetota bacterium]
GIEFGVRSPTFTICQIYDGPVPVHHIDAYRIEDPEELLLQGFDEMRDRGIVAVEWAERVAEVLPPGRLKIELQWVSEHEREIQIRGFGPEFVALVANLPADLPGTSPVA